jgi:hypothetical protein
MCPCRHLAPYRPLLYRFRHAIVISGCLSPQLVAALPGLAELCGAVQEALSRIATAHDSVTVGGQDTAQTHVQKDRIATTLSMLLGAAGHEL